MPRYIIERQYLLPVYQHLALAAPDLESACREALDDGEHDWENAQADYDSPRSTIIVAAVEITSEEEWATAVKSQHELSGLMYDGRHSSRSLVNSLKSTWEPRSLKSSNAMTAAKTAH